MTAFYQIACVLLACCVTSQVEGFNPFSLGNFLKSSPLLKQSQLSEIQNSFSPFLLRGAPMPKANKSPRFGRLIESCGGSDQAINISSLTLKPDPAYFPGQITLGFSVLFQDDIAADAKLNGSLVLELKEGSGGFIKIPCIGNIGSCTYNDICGLMNQIQACPQEFVASGIPCKCPFGKGKYKLEDLNIEIDASVFLPGTYRATVKINDDIKGQLGCYILNFTIG